MEIRSLLYFWVQKVSMLYILSCSVIPLFCMEAHYKEPKDYYDGVLKEFSSSSSSSSSSGIRRLLLRKNSTLRVLKPETPTKITRRAKSLSTYKMPSGSEQSGSSIMVDEHDLKELFDAIKTKRILKKEKIERIKKLIEDYGVHAKDCDGNTLLHVMVKQLCFLEQKSGSASRKKFEQVGSFYGFYLNPLSDWFHDINFRARNNLRQTAADTMENDKLNSERITTIRRDLRFLETFDRRKSETYDKRKSFEAPD